MGGPAANQAVDPAIQQITEFISTSVNDGQDPTDVVVGLIQQEVDQQTIAQAFMQLGYQEEDIVALFEQVQEKSQPAPPSTPEEQTKNPQEIARNEAMVEEAEMQEQQSMVAEQDAMAQQLQAQSGIEIKPENKGKFTRWAKARGMSVSEAYNKVMSNTDNYPPSVVKMANFAKNAAGWKKEEGGDVSNYTEGVRQREGSYNPPNRKYTLDPRFKKEGGEFEPHFMYKGERKIRAKDMATHLRLKEKGYDHEAPKAQGGRETIKKPDRVTFSPNYINPLAFETADNFSIGKAANVLNSGFNAMFAGDKNEDGTKDGSFRDWRRKKKQNQLNKGNYYDYEIKTDLDDPNVYAADNLDLFNASKGKDSLRTLEQYTDDVNENSYANFNSETGNYDTFKSSRGPKEYDYRDRFGLRKRSLLEGNESVENARAGQNLNYFNSVDDSTRQTILDYGKDLKNAPQGTTLSIDPTTGAVSYMNPDAVNPNQYNTMMGYNKSTANTPTANASTSTQAINPIVAPPMAMIPSAPAMSPIKSNTPQAGPTANTTPTFEEWKIKNAVMLQSTPLSQARQLYDNTTFEYGGGLPEAQAGIPGSGMGGIWFDQLDLQNLLNSLQTNQTGQATPKDQLTYEDPTVKRTNKFQGGLDRFMNSNAIKAYGDASEFAVNAADVVNDAYRDIDINNAKVDQYNSLMADNIYGTYEDPNFKRGQGADVISGRFGSDSDKVTGLFRNMSKYGNEMKAEGGEINVDNDTLAALIAAGADIEIL